MTPRRLAALVVALVLGATPAAAQLPIFDAHIHYSQADWTAYTPERALSILAQAGIRRAIVSSTPDDGTLMLYVRIARVRTWARGRATPPSPRTSRSG
jgi:hypothetical protein